MAIVHYTPALTGPLGAGWSRLTSTGVATLPAALAAPGASRWGVTCSVTLANMSSTKRALLWPDTSAPLPPHDSEEAWCVCARVRV